VADVVEGALEGDFVAGERVEAVLRVQGGLFGRVGLLGVEDHAEALFARARASPLLGYLAVVVPVLLALVRRVLDLLDLIKPNMLEKRPKGSKFQTIINRFLNLDDQILVITGLLKFS
jgi:hypothetical protein